jgi:ribonuclease T
LSFASPMATRFRGYLPVVIDIETGGFNPAVHAVLEFAAVLLEYDGEFLSPGRILHYHVHPAPNTVIDAASLKFNGIDPYHPLRDAVPEGQALRDFFREVRHAVRREGCTRATVVAHNAAFDQQFLMAAAERQGLKRNPFHPFSLIDTATLATVAYGHNVLSRACELAGIEFDSSRAHTAVYDADRTAALFCEIVNRWQRFGGWPLAGDDAEDDSDAVSLSRR